MLPLMIFHQIQLIVCSVIASRLGRQAGRRGPGGGEVLIPADVDRVSGQQRKRQRLAAQHLSPQVGPRPD
jgi:hypothetical protein